MEKLIVLPESCKSCRYCITVCPKKALSLSGEINKKGYQYVQVDSSKCVTCGACVSVCPDYVYEIVEV